MTSDKSEAVSPGPGNGDAIVLNRRWPRLELAIPFGIFVFAAFLLAGSLSSFPRVDEIGHLPAGVSHRQFLRFDLYRVNPPLVRSMVTIVSDAGFDWEHYSTQTGQRPEFRIGAQKLKKEGLSIRHRFWIPRMIALGLLLVALLLFFCLVRSATGLIAASLATVLLGTDPNVLAHAASITPDVGALTAGIAVALVGVRFVLGRSSVWALGVICGVAILTKLTWITLVISIPATVVVMRWFGGAQSLGPLSLLKFWLTILLCINVGYAFEDTFTPLGQYIFCSTFFSGHEAPGTLGNRFAESWFSNLPIPLPRNFLLGIDYLRMEVESKMWSFLLGEWKYGSWPHYYLLTTLFKTPVSTLLGSLLGSIVLGFSMARRQVEAKTIAMFLFLGIPASVCFASVSWQGGFNHHHRYVLMIYPFLFALTAFLASPIGMSCLRARLPALRMKLPHRCARSLAVILVLLSVASSLRVHPYYTSYFNSWSGGPDSGWRLLGFSNVDWGQDLMEVKRWVEDHPECRPLVIDLGFDSLSGELLGLPTSKPVLLPQAGSIDDVRETIDSTQWWIISVNRLHNRPGAVGLEYLQQIEPIDKIAYAYHVYRIDPLSRNDRSGKPQ